MIPDPKWLDALKLPARIIAGLFLFCVLLLALDYFTVVSLPELHPLARPVILIGALFFGCLCLTLAAGLIYDARIHNRKRTLLAERHELRRVDRARDKVEYQAQALKRLDHLTDREISYIADCLRKNEQSITTWVYSPEMANLGAAGLVGSPGGKHHQDYYPYFIADFAWAELLKRKDEFIAKDDENERRKAEEKQRAMRR